MFEINATALRPEGMCILRNCHVQRENLAQGLNGYLKGLLNTSTQTPIYRPWNYSPFLVEDSYITRELYIISLFQTKRGADWSVAG